MERKKDIIRVIIYLVAMVLPYYIFASGEPPKKGSLIPGNFQATSIIIREGGNLGYLETDQIDEMVKFINEMEIEETRLDYSFNRTYTVSFINDNYDIITMTFIESNTLYYRFTKRKKKIFSNAFKYKVISGDYKITNKDFDTRIFEEVFNSIRKG